MPYSIRHSGDEWEVYNSASGRVLGTHSSEHDAQAQVRALFANVPDAKTELPDITLRVSQLESLMRYYEEIYE